MNESFAAIGIWDELTAIQTSFAELPDRVEDLTVPVIDIEVGVGASSIG